MNELKWQHTFKEIIYIINLPWHLDTMQKTVDWSPLQKEDSNEIKTITIYLQYILYLF